VALALLLLLVAVIAWGVTSYLAFSDGVEAANARIDARTRAALVPQDGLLLSNPTIVLLLGTDHANRADRTTARRADSILLVRTDPERGRIYYLSIPRDLLVDLPGVGEAKINAAYQVGGAPLAIRAVRTFTGLPVNHIGVVDFGSFEELIDAIGGIEVDVPARIVSNKFDCPYATDARCARWDGWRFGKGKQRMDGRRALVYARIRTNKLDPGESDITRGERQQQVLDAIGEKTTRPTTLARMPFIGDELLRPLATDLTAWEFIQLGWRKFRAERTIHCRLGGEAVSIGGQSFLDPSEDNRNVIAMFLGVTAPQPPRPGSGLYGPGCIRR
jgi:LCP family protein required for cell wall assembly